VTVVITAATAAVLTHHLIKQSMDMRLLPCPAKGLDGSTAKRTAAAAAAIAAAAANCCCRATNAAGNSASNTMWP
jgi:hypothetical protein